MRRGDELLRLTLGVTLGGHGSCSDTSYASRDPSRLVAREAADDSTALARGWRGRGRRALDRVRHRVSHRRAASPLHGSQDESRPERLYRPPQEARLPSPGLLARPEGRARGAGRASGAAGRAHPAPQRERALARPHSRAAGRRLPHRPPGAERQSDSSAARDRRSHSRQGARLARMRSRRSTRSRSTTFESGRPTSRTQDQGPFKPLRLRNLDIDATNIRNVASKDGVYPSDFRLEGAVFEAGRVSAKGRANFLASRIRPSAPTWSSTTSSSTTSSPSRAATTSSSTKGVLSAERHGRVSPRRPRRWRSPRPPSRTSAWTTSTPRGRR